MNHDCSTIKDGLKEPSVESTTLNLGFAPSRISVELLDSQALKSGFSKNHSKLTDLASDSERRTAISANSKALMYNESSSGGLVGSSTGI